MRICHERVLGLILAAAVLAAACASQDDECTGSVDSAAQTGNTFTADGSFSNGQPVLTLTANGTSHVIAATNYGSSRADFDITGLTKGVYSATWEISCEDGSGTREMSSDVPTITIQ